MLKVFKIDGARRLTEAALALVWVVQQINESIEAEARRGQREVTTSVAYCRVTYVVSLFESGGYAVQVLLDPKRDYKEDDIINVVISW